MVDAGLVVVDKAPGMTSHDVVSRVRRLAGTRKVGHAGTLDPMATGVLVLGVERATRLLGHLMLTEKSYDATIRLGVATTTDDAEGEVVSTQPADHLDADVVRRELARFVGEGWNYYRQPDDPIDRPSSLAEQLGWLREIGFVGVDAFWVKAGHALFGGYKGTFRSRE